MTTYKMKYISEHKLRKFGFTECQDWWKYTFSIYKWGRITTIYGSVMVMKEDNEIRIDVFRKNGEFYTPFYKSDYYGNYEIMLNIINSAIKRECKKLGIKEKTNGKKEKAINHRRQRNNKFGVS